MEIIICLIPLVLVLLLFIFPFYSHWQKHRHRDDVWRQIAKTLGVTFSRLPGGDRMIEGTYRGRIVMVYTFSVSRPQLPDLLELFAILLPTRNTRVDISMQRPIDGVELSLSRESLVSRVGKQFGKQDVLVGDEQFDDSFLIKSTPELLAKRVFSRSDLRLRIVDTRVPEFQFDGEDMIWTSYGVVKDADYMQSVINLLCDLLDAIEKESVKD